MKPTIIAIILSVGILGAAIIFSGGNDTAGPAKTATPVNNVNIVGGKQIVDLTARGGYSPKKSSAKAGIPTIVRFKTTGTFDCSAALSIPSLNVSQILPNTGTTDIDVGTPKVGILKGNCGMGMYPFEINFQ